MTKQWMTQTDRKGRTPLHLAAMSGYMSVVRFIVKEIIEATKDIEVRKQYINLADNKGRTPLFHAAAEGHISVTRFLVERGADLEASTNGNHIEPGSTSLMACAEKNAEECFHLLLDKGANVMAMRKDGADALYMAARYGHLEIVQQIAATDKMQLIINRKTFLGRTAIMTAAFHGHLRVCKFLHESGGKINHQDDDKFTALIYAANEGHQILVKWLVDNHADIILENRYGEMALNCADANDHGEIADFLRQEQENLELEMIGELPTKTSRSRKRIKGRVSYTSEKLPIKKAEGKRVS